jgi:hypothetical protein
MKIVIYDTSSIYASNFLLRDKEIIDIIINNAKLYQVKFVTPQIVYDETINKLKEQIKICDKDYVSLRQKCNLFLSNKRINEIFKTTLVSNEDEKNIILELKSFIENFSSIFPYPKIDHATVVKRALNRDKPFDSNGENGYRDTIIWESIKEIALDNKNDTELYFICQNPKDFFDMKEWKNNHYILDNLLLSELDQIGFDSKNIKCYKSLVSFFDNEVFPKLSNFNKIEIAFHNKKEMESELEKQINSSLFDEDDFKEFISYQYDDLDIDYVGLDQIEEILSVKEIDEEKAIAKMKCQIEFSLTAFISKYDYDFDVEDIDHFTDWNDSYFVDEISDLKSIELFIIYDYINKKILSVSRYEK